MANLIETPVDGKNAIIDYLIDSSKATLTALPNRVYKRLREASYEASPVKACVDVAELIYARADVLPPKLLALGVQLSTLVAVNNFHGMAEGGRGLGMAKALKARSGVAAELPGEPAPTAPPVPRTDMLEPVEAAPPAQPAQPA